MRYKLNTEIIDGVEYIKECIFLSENNDISLDKYVINYPIKHLLNGQGKFQYAIIDGEVQKYHQPDSKEDQERKKDIKKLQKIKDNYDLNEEIRLINKAIESIANQSDLPKDYKEYREYVQKIIQED